MARITIEARIAKIRRDREALEKKEQSLLAQSTDRAIKKILTVMKDSGLTAAQVVKALAVAGATAAPNAKGTKAAETIIKGVKPAFAPKAKGGKVAPKYRNPENAEQTWTGRGIPPTWARLMREAGRLNESIIQK